VIFSTGGYSASALIAASKREKISLIIHEQNVIPGRTHRIASSYAKKKCIVFKETKQYLGENCIVTGLPMREVLVVQAIQNKKTTSNETVHTLSFGGSQGATVINEVVLTTAHRVLSNGKTWTHVTGPLNYEACARAVERLCLPEGFRIKAYLEAVKLAQEFSLADMAISRSGAGAICELALFGIPAIFIPYAYAFAGHQEANARVIESLGGASIIHQNELTPERLEHEWIKWSENKDRRMQATENLRNWVVRGATQQVLNIIEKQVYEN
jgi:UDP-N-acetylglucosamine--N-acetylmuramyl-(pentapeptide) pyrophosphoryl-undecaprenol N-acetylglucosamine transferase